MGEKGDKGNIGMMGAEGQVGQLFVTNDVDVCSEIPAYFSSIFHKIGFHTYR